MKYGNIPVYIRFGEIPVDANSKVHFGDAEIRSEGGLSVWRTVKANNKYYPVLPEDPNENAISDYFDMLLNSDKKVYLVTGTEMRIEGADREPLLTDPVIIADVTGDFRNGYSIKGDEHTYIWVYHNHKTFIEGGIVRAKDLTEATHEIINQYGCREYTLDVFHSDAFYKSECISNIISRSEKTKED